jgi:hypothetical protein
MAKDPNYLQPGYGLKNFTCPHCNNKTPHTWGDICFSSPQFALRYQDISPEIRTGSLCWNCHKIIIWKHLEGGKFAIEYPLAKMGPPHDTEWSDEYQKLYEEARSIAAISPRAASALLRMFIEKIADDNGAQKKGTLNKKIQWLIDNKRLDPELSQAFDIVRIHAGETIHPSGEIDLEDDPETLDALFDIAQEVGSHFLSAPVKRKNLWEKLPESKKKQVEERGKKEEPKG